MPELCLGPLPECVGRPFLVLNCGKKTQQKNKTKKQKKTVTQNEFTIIFEALTTMSQNFACVFST